MTDQDDRAARQAGIARYQKLILDAADRNESWALKLIDDEISATGWSTARQFSREREYFRWAAKEKHPIDLVHQVIGGSLLRWHELSALKAARWDYDRWLAKSVERAADNDELQEEVLGGPV